MPTSKLERTCNRHAARFSTYEGIRNNTVVQDGNLEQACSQHAENHNTYDKMHSSNNMGAWCRTESLKAYLDSAVLGSSQARFCVLSVKLI